MTTPLLPIFKKQFRELRPPGFPMVFLCSFIIIGTKNGFNGIFYPLLYNEDGRNIFAIFFNQHQFENIFISYASYIRVIPNLIGYILNFLPVRWIPPMYCLISLLITALAYSLFFKVLTRVFDNRWFAAYSVLIISALPLGNFEIVGTLMYQIWNCNLILFLMVLLPVPVLLWYRVGYIAAAHLLIWTHPYTIIALPLYILNFITSKKNGLVYSGFVLSTIIYFLIGVRSHPLDFSSLKYFFPNLLSRVVNEAFVGSHNRVHFQYLDIIGIFDLIILSTLGIIIIFSWKNWQTKQKLFLFICLYLCVIPLVAALVGRELGDYYHLLRGSPRYIYLPKIFFFTIVLFTAFQIYKKSPVFQRWHFVIVLGLLFINLNSNTLYKTDIKVGKETLAFIHKVDRNSVLCSKDEHKNLSFDRGQWTFHIDLCKS
jgi:hypothetical protein